VKRSASQISRGGEHGAAAAGEGDIDAWIMRGKAAVGAGGAREVESNVRYIWAQSVEALQDAAARSRAQAAATADERQRTELNFYASAMEARARALPAE
jgi:hypothetical protein